MPAVGRGSSRRSCCAIINTARKLNPNPSRHLSGRIPYTGCTETRPKPDASQHVPETLSLTRPPSTPPSAAARPARPHVPARRRRRSPDPHTPGTRPPPDPAPEPPAKPPPPRTPARQDQQAASPPLQPNWCARSTAPSAPPAPRDTRSRPSPHPGSPPPGSRSDRAAAPRAAPGRNSGQSPHVPEFAGFLSGCIRRGPPPSRSCGQAY